MQASSASGSALLGLLGIVIEGLDVLLGVQCSPITVVGVGSSGTCSGTVVCCEDNAVVRTLLLSHKNLYTHNVLQDNLISIGCLPIVL